MALQAKCRNIETGEIYESQAQAARTLKVPIHSVKKLVEKIGVAQRAKKNINFLLNNLSDGKSRTDKAKTEEAKRKLAARREIEDRKLDLYAECREVWQ